MIADRIKSIPSGENLSKYIIRESTGLEKNNVTIAPRAMISPWAKFTIRVTL